MLRPVAPRPSCLLPRLRQLCNRPEAHLSGNWSAAVTKTTGVDRRLLGGLAVICAMAGTMAVPAAAQATPLDDANSVRAQAGLPLLTQAEDDGAARQVNEALLVSGGPGLKEDGGDESCGCALYADGNSDDPAVYAVDRYRQLGGTRPVAFWTYYADAGPLVNRTIWALLLDPRARSMRFSEDGNAVSIAVFMDPSARFSVAQPSRAGSFDPLGKVPLFALVPSINAKTTIYRGAGKRWYEEISLKGEIEYSARDVDPVDGYGDARLVNVASAASETIDSISFTNTGDGIIFAHSTRYRIGNTEFKTTPMPSAVVRRKFAAAKSMTARYRKVVNRRLRTTPRAVRKAIDLVDGLTTLKTHSGGGFSVTGWSSKDGIERPYHIDYLRWHLIGEKQPLGHLITVHELSHLLDMTGLTFGGQKAFRDQYRRSRGYRRCFPGGDTQCVQAEEILADVMAFGMGADRRIRDGYGVPPLLSRGQFNRLFRIWWAPKPVAYGFAMGPGSLVEGGSDREEVEGRASLSGHRGARPGQPRSAPSAGAARRAIFRAR